MDNVQEQLINIGNLHKDISFENAVFVFLTELSFLD